MIRTEKTLVVDVDGTLCPQKPEDLDYRDLPADPAMKARLADLRAMGWYIVVFSSRGMRTYGGDVAAIMANVLPPMVEWLDRHGIAYDEVRLAKPWPGHDGFYVDDRAVRPREFLTLSLEQLDERCAADRIA
ncbi:MAG: capsular biosynthesis protein [Rudaea sp.]|nr:capsular biosynthesis protein [Rudaea sp.]